MNKFVNFVSLVILVPYALFALAVAQELELWPEKNAAHLPYQSQIATVIFAVTLILNLLRVYQKWSVIAAFWKTDNFQIRVPIKTSWYTSRSIPNLLEAFYSLAFGFFFIQNDELTRNLGLVLLFFGVENIFYIIWVRVRKLYAVAINKKALILLDRQFSAYYFHGLRKMEKDFDQIYFEYLDGLQLKFPLKALEKEQQKEITHIVLDNINQNKVYVDQDLV